MISYQTSIPIRKSYSSLAFLGRRATVARAHDQTLPPRVKVEGMQVRVPSWRLGIRTGGAER